MTRLGLEEKITDLETRERTIAHLRKLGVTLPTFAELTDPSRISSEIRTELASVDPDAPHPRNLFRVHWHNTRDTSQRVEIPEHIVLPQSLTGIKAPIIVLFGDRFPMIYSHKVLAAYACLVPRLVTGQFDPTRDRALWPSTGNYCRGGVAISRILGCRGVAILPEGMSQERFDWLKTWTHGPEDILKTPGTESNVKEIYDACDALERQDSRNVVFNQFSEFGNHLVHYRVTGEALSRVFEHARRQTPELALRAFVSATGSAGTIGAGDLLKERYDARIVAAEALECPTMLYNGFGTHNIQGIGDKHIPLIHNVMNTDIVTAVSDAATDDLGLLFSHPAGLSFLRERARVPEPVLSQLSSFGLSSICNVLAAIKTARYLGLGEHDALMTVATDGAAMYGSERERTLNERYGGRFDETDAAAIYGRHMLGADASDLLELSHVDRRRIYNLGYFTWVEQRGVSLADFEARRSGAYWAGLRRLLDVWDELIEDMNQAILQKDGG